MKKALEYIVSSIVDNPDQVVITEQEDNGTINFTIAVAKADMGKIIGKNGKIIKSIRNVMKIPAIKNEKRIYLSLQEDVVEETTEEQA